MDTTTLMHLAMTVGWVTLLGYIFAQAEVHIEGEAGWAANLPTWRIEEHWLLDVFWGGRAMTGYHAWVFPFIAVFFHFPLFFFGEWTWQLEARVIASIMWFWIVEDFLWFILNPAFGWKRFNKDAAAWHKNWIAGAPVEYWIFSVVSAVLFWYSYFPF
jgi:hypothetical protein